MELNVSIQIGCTQKWICVQSIDINPARMLKVKNNNDEETQTNKD